MEFIDTSLYDCRRPNPNNGNEFIYDRPLDWSKQVENGAKLAFIKSSESSYEDPGFKVQWNAAKKTNLILGAWHFFHPIEDAISQARVQINLLKSNDVKMELYNSLGEKIMTQSAGMLAAGAHQLNLNTENLPAGMYQLNVNVGNNIYNIKVNKMN